MCSVTCAGLSIVLNNPHSKHGGLVPSTWVKQMEAQRGTVNCSKFSSCMGGVRNGIQVLTVLLTLTPPCYGQSLYASL